MNSSTSLPHNGVILDTNVISVFAKINRLDLLLKIFNSTRHEIQFYITPTIQNELVTGLQNNIPYLADALRLVEAGKLQILQPTKADQLVIRGLPAKLAPGEAEAIALCHRLALVFITHDRKAINYCQRVGISCIRLTSLLDRLKAAHLLTDAEIQSILE